MQRDEIEEKTIDLANEIGLINVTKDVLCDVLQIPTGSFNNLVGCSFTDFISEIHSKRVCEIGEINSRMRVNPNLMKDIILNTFTDVSEQQDYKTVTRGYIAEKIGITAQLITHYFGEMELLRNEVVKKAIKDKNLKIIGQAVAFKDPIVNDISNNLKINALKASLNG